MFKGWPASSCWWRSIGTSAALGLLSGLVQGMKTRTPKAVPLKVPLSALLIWPLHSLRNPLKKGPQNPSKGTKVRAQGRPPGIRPDKEPDDHIEVMKGTLNPKP